MKPSIALRAAAVAETILVAGLAFLLLLYGGVKVFGTQFHVRGYMLDLRAGDLGGGQLVWLLHGYSRRYELAVGLAECAAALLLLWPRTRGIGTLACIAVLANITLLNIEYEIGALAMAGAMLGAAIAAGLFRLVRGGRESKAGERATRPPRFFRIAGAAVLILVPVAALAVAWEGVRAVEAERAGRPIAGRYVLARVETEGGTAQTSPELAPGAYLYLEFNGEAALRSGESWRFGEYRLDGAAIQIDLYPLAPAETGRLDGQEPEPVRLEIRGEYAPDDAGGLRITCSSPGPMTLHFDRADRPWPVR